MSAARPGAAAVAESVLLQLPVRLVLGGAFVVAGWMKLFHGVWDRADPTQTFAESIKAYRVLDPQTHLGVLTNAAFVLPWGELIAGVLLVLGAWTRAAALVVAGMLVLFTGATISLIAREISTSCACFGALEWPCGSTVGWCQVGRNAVLLVGAAYLIWRGGGVAALDRSCPRPQAP